MLVAEKNRLFSASKAIRTDIKEHVGWLEKRIKESDCNLEKLVKKSPVWREKDVLLRSVLQQKHSVWATRAYQFYKLEPVALTAMGTLT